MKPRHTYNNVQDREFCNTRAATHERTQQPAIQKNTTLAKHACTIRTTKLPSLAHQQFLWWSLTRNRINKILQTCRHITHYKAALFCTSATFMMNRGTKQNTITRKTYKTKASNTWINKKHESSIIRGPKYTRKHEESTVRDAQNTANMPARHALQSCPVLHISSIYHEPWHKTAHNYT